MEKRGEMIVERKKEEGRNVTQRMVRRVENRVVEKK